MNRRQFLSLGLAPLAQAASPKRPNVIVILADDLGYGDLSCYGNTFAQTTNIDRLAREGRKFTQGYTPSSVCSPTRYALMTGRYCWRTSLQRQVLNVNAPLHIEPSRLTLASLFKKQGYTGAAIGKWHLGYGTNAQVDWNQPLRPGPLELGFDYHFGVPSNHGDLTRAFVENDQVVGRAPGETYMVGKKNQAPKGLAAPRVDDRVNLTLAEKAVAFIERSKDKPFFLYFTPVGVHNPVTPNKQFRGKSRAGIYGDYLLETDFAVGRILDTLDQHKLTQNTVVIFSSDNGAVVMSYGGNTEAAQFELNLEDDTDGAVTKHYRTAQADAEKAGHKAVGALRGRKHSIYEGGFRVPFIVRWPGVTKAGSTSNEVVQLADWLATFCGWFGEKIPAGAAEDSYDIMPALRQDKLKNEIREATVVHNAEGVFAIRKGPWKAVEKREYPGEPMIAWRREGTKNQLYNLAADPAEKNDVWDQNPEVGRELLALLERYRKQGHSAKRAR